MATGDWKVLIADDEPAARRGVRQLLDAFPQFHVAVECRNGREVLRALDDVKPHVVFLDIQMPGMDGFEVIRQRTSARMPVVVFLTAYDEFALKAFDAEAMDYLVKPVSQERFAASIHRVLRRLQRSEGSDREAGLVVNTPRGTVVLRLREIDWMESADNYSRLWVGSRSYLVRESLNALEERVRRHGFERAHRQALVRIGAVRELARKPTGEVVAILASGAHVPVSRRRRAAFHASVAAVDTHSSAADPD